MNNYIRNMTIAVPVVVSFTSQSMRHPGAEKRKRCVFGVPDFMTLAYDSKRGLVLTHRRQFWNDHSKRGQSVYDKVCEIVAGIMRADQE